MNEYEGVHRVTYADGAQFVPVCEHCGRFVKPDKLAWVNEATGLKNMPNAECSRCGRTRMIFEGFVGEDS